MTRRLYVTAVPSHEVGGATWIATWVEGAVRDRVGEGWSPCGPADPDTVAGWEMWVLSQLRSTDLARYTWQAVSALPVGPIEGDRAPHGVRLVFEPLGS